MANSATLHIKLNPEKDKYLTELARKRHTSKGELIREAMKEYQQTHLQTTASLKDIQPISVGKVYRPLTDDDDLLGEMLDEDRN